MIDLWQEIYGTIKRNKLRTFLTGFAVAWGIFMLIVLLGAGNGIIHAFEQNASERALNSIRLGGGWTTQSYEGLKEGRRIQLENKDLAATEKYFPDNIITAGATLRRISVFSPFGIRSFRLRVPFLRFCGTFFQRPKAPHSHCFHRLFAVILSSVHGLFTKVSSFFSPHPLLFLYRYATIQITYRLPLGGFHE